METRFLLDQKGKEWKVKGITILENPYKLKMILDKLTWQILMMLNDKAMYPLEIARKLGIHEQKVYYHVRKLADAGVVKIIREVDMKGATAKYYKAVSSAFGIELPRHYKKIQRLTTPSIDEKINGFFKEFIDDNGQFDGKIIVGSPTPHGPFKTCARDGHYAAHLTFFLGQFTRMPAEFMIKLDVDVKVEKEEKNNLILVGGPGTKLMTQEIIEYLPITFDMQPSKQGFMFGGLFSKKTRNVYTTDVAGLVAKIINPWDKAKRIVILAGIKAVGTKACVLALTNFWNMTLQSYNHQDTFAKVIQGFDLDGDGKVDSVEILE